MRTECDSTLLITPAAADNATRADDGIHGNTHAVAFIGKHELDGRRLRLVSPDGANAHRKG